MSIILAKDDPDRLYLHVFWDRTCPYTIENMEEFTNDLINFKYVPKQFVNFFRMEKSQGYGKKILKTKDYVFEMVVNTFKQKYNRPGIYPLLNNPIFILQNGMWWYSGRETDYVRIPCELDIIQ